MNKYCLYETNKIINIKKYKSGRHLIVTKKYKLYFDTKTFNLHRFQSDDEYELYLAYHLSIDPNLYLNSIYEIHNINWNNY